ncbi:MAG: hypothetical protein KJP08_08310 [Gammaproteobacteria bacterium]|nr:hypothetical protein [Gammaproteobacteria bacterium]NNF49307.1 hypothetical protein [Woeseiaceae bacterium]MBT8094799.1 hypothetical protein [Gammaproteobacteria bacterium]MBT8105969.1 hypothetical protein [Gammaproteobacteria bacterium]NNK25982.1 hypothetical protein [Woeseiaceae bacterium]
MSPAPTAGGHEAPLEDLMVAMDVVDTIRHRQLIVERELDAVGRRERLIERLREIYTAQGIEVTDAALAAGVDALEQERFGYTPTPRGLSASLARMYVRRERWLRPLSLVAALALIIWTGWFFTVQLPQSRFEAALPGQIEATYSRVIARSESEPATARAEDLLARAQGAIRSGDFDKADALRGELEALRQELLLAYEIRIVSRPGEYSAIWRVPDINPDARNYYLIVEAVDPDGKVLRREIRNEEDGRLYNVRKWGMRVDDETFNAVAADKRDDGIIEDYVIGTKAVGGLEPEYRVPTTGATITDW